MEAGLATTPMRWPRRRPESRSLVEPRTMDMGVTRRSWSTGPALPIGLRASLRQRPIPGLDDPAQSEGAGESREPHPGQHVHRRPERGGAAAPADLADEERPDRGRHAPDVVAEAGAGPAQPCREQLGQIV